MCIYIYTINMYVWFDIGAISFAMLYLYIQPYLYMNVMYVCIYTYTMSIIYVCIYIYRYIYI